LACAMALLKPLISPFKTTAILASTLVLID
jgi:hypothetical protein